MNEEPGKDADGDLLAASAVPSTDSHSFEARLVALPAGARFQRGDAWCETAKAPDPWRRLAALRILLERVLAFPLARERFEESVLAPLGIGAEAVSELPIASALPFETGPEDRVFRADLRVRTSIGPASLYFAVSGPDGLVTRAAAYPKSVEAGEESGR